MSGINGVGRVGIRNYVAPSTSTNPLWNSLVAYYTGDNTSNDTKGTANGTLINGTTYATGKINNGFSLDGINDYVTLPSGTFNPVGSYTISQWINSQPIASDSARGIFIVGNALVTNTIAVYMYNDGGTPYIRFLNSNNTTYQLIQSTLPSFNNYHHIVSIKNTTDNKYYLYVNGTLVAQATITVNFVPATLSTIIGSLGGVYGPFLGKIDEVALWDGKALTSTEVTELYNAGAGKQYIATTPTYTARTTAFATATGITDTTILNALNTFDTGLISNGLDTKMKALYPMVGGTANTHKFNFMDAQDTDTAFRLAFNGGWVHSSTGAKPNGTNAFADTKLNLNTMNSINDISYGYYCRTNSISLGSFGWGKVPDKYLSNEFWIRYNDDNKYGYIFDSANDGGSAGGDCRGFNAQSRIASNVKYIQKNSLISTYTSLSTGSLFSRNFIFSQGSQGYENRENAFGYISNGLTNTELSNLYTLTQALQTSLSRQV